jgi:hypothetical protein
LLSIYFHFHYSAYSNGTRSCTQPATYNDVMSFLKNIPDGCLPTMQKWTAEDLKVHDTLLWELTEDETHSLESFRFQESRKLQWNEIPLVRLNIFPVLSVTRSVENYTPSRAPGECQQTRTPRPWEFFSSHETIPAWLRCRQLKRDGKHNKWDPSMKPIYPTFVFDSS